MPWLVIAGAGYLILATVLILALCRAAARGDAQRGMRETRSRPHEPDPAGEPRPAADTRPRDRAS